MDITSVTGYRVARTRDDLALAHGETFLAGGSWLMSQPQPHVSGFVDLSGLGWDELHADETGLRIGATCTIARLVAGAERLLSFRPEWQALRIVPAAANALLGSFKIWNTATVGGNICRGFAAGAMTTLAVALDAVAEVWMPDGTAYRLPVADVVTGNGTTMLGHGEVLRAVHVPAAALGARAALRKIALAEHGRSGAVVTGRVHPGGSSVFTVTAATEAPTVLRFASTPTPAVLDTAVAAAPRYYSDPLGAADWRRGVSRVLAGRVLADLVEAA